MFFLYRKAEAFVFQTPFQLSSWFTPRTKGFLPVLNDSVETMQVQACRFMAQVIVYVINKAMISND